MIPPPMKFTCDYCSRPLRVNRHICGACYKLGYSVNSPSCKDCGAPTSNRQRTLCEECRKDRRHSGEDRYVGKQAVLGPERDQIMLEAETPLREDTYALSAHVLTDEEFTAKREKYLALLAADIHVGTYASGHKRAVRDDSAEAAGFGRMANQHMRGGVAGGSTDRDHTFRAQESREYRARRDS
jgi:hypothetical protein